MSALFALWILIEFLGDLNMYNEGSLRFSWVL